MTIPEAREKCKNLLASIPRDALCLAILVLASMLSFGLGFLAGKDAGASKSVTLERSSAESSSSDSSGEQGQVVASQSGTRYYFPDCPGAGRISEANKVWFVSAAAAEAAGYTLAANCRP